MATAQVSRFRDKVAVYLANGATVYLSPFEADCLGDALKRAAESCRSEPFAKSTFGTFTIEMEKD